jgi:hypothetical protein
VLELTKKTEQYLKGAKFEQPFCYKYSLITRPAPSGSSAGETRQVLSVNVYLVADSPVKKVNVIVTSTKATKAEFLSRNEVKV